LTGKNLRYGILKKLIMGIASNMDQLLSMSRLAETGAGIMLRSDTVNVEDIRSSVSRLLTEKSFSTAATRIARQFSEYPAEKNFLSVLSELLEPPEQRPAAVANI